MNDWFYIWDTHSAFGWAALAGTAHGVRRLDFGYPSQEECLTRARIYTGQTPAHKLRAGNTITHPGPKKGPAWLFPAVVAITRALLGQQAPLHRIPRDWTHSTDYQQAVWRAAMHIPYGQTRTYAWIAARTGRPRAARAAGTALAANPLPLIVPCHRIIKSNGHPGGFAMGTDIKQKLLKLEKINVTKTPYR